MRMPAMVRVMTVMLAAAVMLPVGGIAFRLFNGNIRHEKAVALRIVRRCVGQGLMRRSVFRIRKTEIIVSFVCHMCTSFLGFVRCRHFCRV